MDLGQGETGVAWFAPDSNFFLQCKAPAELDWSLVTNAAEVVLVAVRTVQREIDGLKGAGNQRRADRARKISSIFKELVSKDSVVVLRERGPRLVLTRGPRLVPGRDMPEGFDPGSSDDAIVEQVMATGIQLDVSLALLTHDSGPLQTAHDFNLPCTGIPDAWLLPPEPDGTAKRMTELERKVEHLSAQRPKMVADVFQDDVEVSVIRGAVDRFGSLSEEFIEMMRHAVADRHPIGTLAVGSLDDLRAGQLRDYQRSYHAWLDGLAVRMESLAEVQNRMLDPVEFEVHLNNIGVVTAEHPQVDIEVHGGIRLMRLRTRTEWEREGGRLFPDPPRVPPARGAITLPDPHRADPPPIYVREPLGFQKPPILDFSWYYDEPTLASKKCMGDRLTFRHGLDGEKLVFHVVPAPDEPGAVEGSLSIRVSANNLPTPFAKTVKVEIQRRETNVESRVKDVLKKEFSLRIR